MKERKRDNVSEKERNIEREREREYVVCSIRQYFIFIMFFAPNDGDSFFKSENKIFAPNARTMRRPYWDCEIIGHTFKTAF